MRQLDVLGMFLVLFFWGLIGFDRWLNRKYPHLVIHVRMQEARVSEVEITGHDAAKVRDAITKFQKEETPAA